MSQSDSGQSDRPEENSIDTGFKDFPLLDGGRTHWRDTPIEKLRCENCEGWGTVNRARPLPKGWVTCPDCDGTGRLERVRANIRDGKATFSTGVRGDYEQGHGL